MPRASSSPAWRAELGSVGHALVGLAVGQQHAAGARPRGGLHRRRDPLGGLQPALEQVGAAARRSRRMAAAAALARGVHGAGVEQQLGLAVEGHQAQAVARGRGPPRRRGRARGLDLLAGHAAGDVDGEREVERRRSRPAGRRAAGGEVGDEIADGAALVPGDGPVEAGGEVEDGVVDVVGHGFLPSRMSRMRLAQRSSRARCSASRGPRTSSSTSGVMGMRSHSSARALRAGSARPPASRRSSASKPAGAGGAAAAACAGAPRLRPGVGRPRPPPRPGGRAGSRGRRSAPPGRARRLPPERQRLCRGLLRREAGGLGGVAADLLRHGCQRTAIAGRHHPPPAV